MIFNNFLMSFSYSFQTIKVPPNIVDEASSADTLASEGMRVTLSCHAEGNPTPIITWRREDRGEIKICTEDDSFR